MQREIVIDRSCHPIRPVTWEYSSGSSCFLFHYPIVLQTRFEAFRALQKHSPVHSIHSAQQPPLPSSSPLSTTSYSAHHHRSQPQCRAPARCSRPPLSSQLSSPPPAFHTRSTADSPPSLWVRLVTQRCAAGPPPSRALTLTVVAGDVLCRRRWLPTHPSSTRRVRDHDRLPILMERSPLHYVSRPHPRYRG